MVADDPRPSYEELAALVAVQAKRIAELEAEIAELRRQLGQNSQNSSKPPSTDSPFTKPAPKSLRRKSGRKPGGQPGHPGSTLTLVADPNERLRHEPGQCAACGADLAAAPEVGMERRQVFDLPPMTVRVTEHQLIARRCSCGTTTCGAPPAGVTAPVQYGPRITAIILYLYVGQFMSKKRTAQALAELFGTPVSEGTVATMTTRAADGLDGFLDQVKDRIVESETAGFDETGLRVAGKLHWVHCARTGRYTLITCHTKRGREGIDDMGVLGLFRGVAVHDAWAPYDTYIESEHQLCCAHALRELQGVADTAPPDAQWCWATQVSTRWSRCNTWQPTRSPPARTGSIPTPSPNRSGATAQPPRSASPRPPPARTNRCRSTTRSPVACSTGKTTTCASPPAGEYRPTTTDPNATSA